MGPRVESVVSQGDGPGAGVVQGHCRVSPSSGELRPTLPLCKLHCSSQFTGP